MFGDTIGEYLRDVDGLIVIQIWRRPREVFNDTKRRSAMLNETRYVN